MNTQAHTRTHAQRWALLFLAFGLTVVLLGTAAGSQGWQAWWSAGADAVSRQIVWDIRLPRSLGARTCWVPRSLDARTCWVPRSLGARTCWVPHSSCHADRDITLFAQTPREKGDDYHDTASSGCFSFVPRPEIGPLIC